MGSRPASNRIRSARALLRTRSARSAPVLAVLAVASRVALSGCSRATASPTAAPTTSGTASATPAPATTEPLVTSAPAASPSAAPTTERPAVSSSGTKSWQDLQAGECIGRVPNGQITELTLVTCSAPHQAETVTSLRAVTLGGQPARDAASKACTRTVAALPGSSGLTGAPIVETQGTLIVRSVCLAVDKRSALLRGALSRR